MPDTVPTILSLVNGVWVATPVGPDAAFENVAKNQPGRIVSNGFSTAMDISGILSATTFIDASSTFGRDTPSGPFLEQNTPASTTQSGWRFAAVTVPFTYGMHPRCVWRFSLQHITDIRVFIGLIDTTLFRADIDIPPEKHIGLSFSTPGADTTYRWRIFGSGSPFSVGTGVAPSVGTVLFADINQTADASVTLTLRDANFAALSSNTVVFMLPTPSTGLAPQMAVQGQNFLSRTVRQYGATMELRTT